MKISHNWLRQYLDLEATVEELTDVLPLLGFDIEAVLNAGPPPLEKVVVAEVLDYGRHPNADKLRLCKVSDGGETPLSIVCGASNFEAGDRVVLALPGAVLPGDFKIKKSKLRGETSEGMLCSPRELGLGEDHAGILVLPPDAVPGTPINDYYGEGDTVLDLEVTPNRPDALSHLGIARELAAYYGLEVRYPEVEASTENPVGGDETPLLKAVDVLAEEACPLYTAICVRGVRVGPSPEWLRSALEGIGLRPVNNVVDVTNYVLHETGQPLHAFDAAKIEGGRLTVRYAGEGERITTLDDKERVLRPDMAVIADDRRPLVVAGVMGAEDAEVGSETTDIVLEAAYFQPSSVRSTSRALGLSTDSSYRFERGTDPDGVEYAALRAVDLILLTAGGAASGNLLVEGHMPEILTEVTLVPDRVRRFIGFDVPDARIREVLESLGMSVSRHDAADGTQQWDVSVPSYRQDLQRPEDLIEEFVRLHGTDRIPETELCARGIGGSDDPIQTFNERAAQYLTGAGFHEALTYSLREAEETRRFFGEGAESALVLANPLQSDQSHLRPSLLPGLLDVLKLNFARQTGARRFFERGRTFRESGGRLCEVVSVAFVQVADPVTREWRSRESADFYTARAVGESLLGLAGVSCDECRFAPVSEAELWQEGHAARAGDLGTNGFECEAGLLAMATLAELWDIGQPVVAGTVSFMPGRLAVPEAMPRFAGISAFPPTLKDLALIVDAGVLADEVVGAVREAADAAVGDFACESVRVFDVYTGEGLPEGTKSLALTLTFRATGRTLKDKEVNAAFDRIQKTITGETEYRIRK